jgi:hypothetical protein
LDVGLFLTEMMSKLNNTLCLFEKLGVYVKNGKIC